jgi:F-type H+-transporting ATPase subunit a
MHEAHFYWLDLLNVPEESGHVVMALLVAGILVLTTAVARTQLVRQMSTTEGGLVPDEHWSFKNFFEIVAESLFKLTESVIGHHDAPAYFPIIGTLFLFIFMSNIIGLVPGFLPPTENFNTTLGLGVFVFLYYNYVGLRAHGIKYLKQFMGPVLWLAPLMFIIEVASHIFRPLSLALRLRGNIMGDHVVLGVFSGLVPYLLPVVFYGLGVFVAFIQAFVFCLMTMVYISLSISHDH